MKIITYVQKWKHCARADWQLISWSGSEKVKQHAAAAVITATIGNQLEGGKRQLRITMQMSQLTQDALWRWRKEDGAEVMEELDIQNVELELK